MRQWADERFRNAQHSPRALREGGFVGVLRRPANAAVMSAVSIADRFGLRASWPRTSASPQPTVLPLASKRRNDRSNGPSSTM
jgi:hypothetical protein